ncbi:MAG: methyltransferase domain-containing protein [Candidatus Electrothrix sp. GW3-4]|uniref:methyltransferase domain-containing protein n=1 Tax=Candidatus Electrothrix sp. GW3-4 TaxID=3126740 RepID=UPI0030D016CF
MDLGSGSGVECFLAAAEVGASGQVFGIDMTDAMLELARSSQKHVVTDLGYDNIEFRKGYLEAIPLADETADVVISNCVINLSPDKRRTYLEIMRILKPGGRLVVADVVSDTPISAAIKNSTKYRGECLGGAMQQDDLVAMLEDCGFSSIYLHKRFSYREVDGHFFYSLTYEAGKAERAEGEEERVRCLFRGPAPALETPSGVRLERGHITALSRREAEQLSEQVFLLDEEGAVANIEQEACCCAVPQMRPGRIMPSSQEALPLSVMSVVASSAVKSWSIKAIAAQRRAAFSAVARPLLLVSAGLVIMSAIVVTSRKALRLSARSA